MTDLRTMAQALLDSVLKSAKDSYETETGSIETDWPIADAEEYKIWSELRAALAQATPAPAECPSCDGTGDTRDSRSHGTAMIASVCKHCNGTGTAPEVKP